MQPRQRKRGTPRASADGALSDSDHSFCSAHSSAPIRRCFSPEPRSVRPEALAYLQGLLATPEGTERVLRACVSACLLPANLAGTDSNLSHSASSALTASRPLTQSSPTSRPLSRVIPQIGASPQPPSASRAHLRCQQSTRLLLASHVRFARFASHHQLNQILPQLPPRSSTPLPPATPMPRSLAPTATLPPPPPLLPQYPLQPLPHLPRCLHSREPVPVRTLSVSGTTGVTSASCSLGRAARAMQVGVTFRCSA